MGNIQEIFTEEAIRPSRLVQQMEKLCEEDRQWLLTHQNQFVPVNCPACGKNKFHEVFIKLNVRFVECYHCKTVYANPRPSPGLLKQHYLNSKSYKFWCERIFPQSEPVRREKIFKKRVDFIIEQCKRFKVNPDTILEIGSGFGTFCLETQTRNFFKHVIAVEPIPELAEICRKRGLRVIQAFAEDLQASKITANVIVSFETIEHVFSPADFLGVCHNILNPHGLIFLTCPNMHGFDTSLLREKSKSVGGEHINLFNPTSIKILLERGGFKLKLLQTPGVLDAELVRKSALAGEYDLTSQPFLKRVLIDEWETLGPPFQRFLAENLLSSHMQVIAQNA